MNKTNCNTCLSLDRKLKPIKPQDQYLFTMLCPEMFSKKKSQYLICWECEFMINKIKLFQAKLTKANNALKLHIKGKTKVFEGLSKLKVTEVITISIRPQHTTLPENTPSILHNTQFPSLKEMLAAPLRLDTQPATIKMEVEDEGSRLDGDYNDLIQPSTIQHYSEDPLLLPIQDILEITNNWAENEDDTHEPIKDVIVTSNVNNYLPQKLFIKTSKELVALRGSREPVKVTGSAPKLATSKKKNPSTIRNSEETDQHTVKGKVSNLNLDNLLTNLLEAPSDPKELFSIKELVPNDLTPSKECSEGRTNDQDVAKCIILSRVEVNALRDKNKCNPTYAKAQFKCEKCIECYQTHDKLDEHNKKHDKSLGTSICEICEQRFADDLILNEHYKLHFIVYGCVQCPYQHSKRLRLSEHNRKNHEESLFYCNHCDADFKTFREKHRHVRKEHAKKIKCEECGKLLTRHQMTLHMTNIHRQETVKCPICEKKIRKYYLKYHMKTHDKKRDIVAYCADCGTSYKSKYSYDLHLKTSLRHNTIEKLGIKCQHCDQYFANKQSLKNHIEAIIGVRYTCDICKKDSKNKRNLIHHIQVVHEGKKPKGKPIMCEICGKSYRVKKNLEEHINCHLGRRTHVCADCGATFIYSSALFTHRRHVHKDKVKTK